MLIDTHCHLYFDRFDADRGEVLDRMAEAGVDGAVVIGIDAGTTEQARQLALRYSNLHFTAGLHPTSEFPDEVKAGEPFDARAYFEPWLAGEPGIVAIGECGVDLHWDTNTIDDQQRVFRAQLELACLLDLPVVVHSRDADRETLEVLESVADTKGILHCFNGSSRLLEFALRNPGWFISFAGNLTYPKAVKLHAVARLVPLDRLLVETDAPFMAPQPRRGKRCEPADVRHTASFLAAALNMPVEKLLRQLRSNTERCFGIAW